MKQYSTIRFLALTSQISSGTPLLLLIGSAILSLTSGIFDARLAILLGEASAKYSSNIGLSLCQAYLISSVSRLMSSLTLFKGSSLAGYKIATRVFSGIQSNDKKNQLQESELITLLTRNIDFFVNRYFNPIYLLLGNILSGAYLVGTAVATLKGDSFNLSSNQLSFILIAITLASAALYLFRKKGKNGGIVYKNALINATLIAKDYCSVLDEIKVSGSSGYIDNLHRENEKLLRNTESNLTIIPNINSFTIEVIGVVMFAVCAANSGISEILSLGYIALRLLPKLNLIIASYLRVSNIMPTLKLCYPYLERRREIQEDAQRHSIGNNENINPFRIDKLDIPAFSVEFGDETTKIIYPKTQFVRGKLNLVLGQSGSGKTTYIKSILGLDSPHALQSYNQNMVVTMVDKLGNQFMCMLSEIKKNVSYCPQIPRIVSGTIKDNLSISIASLDLDKAYSLMTELRLDHLKDTTDCKTLSGGEQKRLALLRTILLDKPIVIFDEPTAGLGIEDINISVAFLLKASQSAIVIVVTHEPILIHSCFPAMNLE